MFSYLFLYAGFTYTYLPHADCRQNVNFGGLSEIPAWILHDKLQGYILDAYFTL